MVLQERLPLPDHGLLCFNLALRDGRLTSLQTLHRSRLHHHHNRPLPRSILLPWNSRPRLGHHLLLRKIRPDRMEARGARRSPPHVGIRPLRSQHLGHPHSIHPPHTRRYRMAPVRNHPFRHPLCRRSRRFRLWTKRIHQLLGEGLWVHEPHRSRGSDRLPLLSTLVRAHPRTQPGQLLHGRISRRTLENRRHLPLPRLHRNLLDSSPRLRSLPKSSLRLRDLGGSVLESFLPKVQDRLLDVLLRSLLGDNVPHAPLPHRRRRRRLPRHLLLLLPHARRAQGVGDWRSREVRGVRLVGSPPLRRHYRQRRARRSGRRDPETRGRRSGRRSPHPSTFLLRLGSYPRTPHFSKIKTYQSSGGAEGGGRGERGQGLGSGLGWILEKRREQLERDGLGSLDWAAGVGKELPNPLTEG